MNKRLGIFATCILVISLFLSSCSSSSENTLIDSGIPARLVTATGFDWEIIPLDSYNRSESLIKFWKSNGYVEEIWPSNQVECLMGIYVFENQNFAKKAMETKYFDTRESETFNGFVQQIEDPITKYGIILLHYGDPCSQAASSIFGVNSTQ